VSELPANTESVLGSSPSLFSLFVLLRDSVPQEAIRARYGLTDTDMFFYGKDLEALGLAELMPGGHIRLRGKGAVKFRRGGALEKRARSISLDFVAKASADPADAHYQSISRRLRPDTADRLRAAIDELVAQASEDARRDQMMFPDNELTTHKLVVAWGPVDFSEFVFVEPHPRVR